MAIGRGKEGAGWSKAFRERSMGLNVVRGVGGNGITGKYFLQLEMLLGWNESLLVDSSLDYPLEKRVDESRRQRARGSGRGNEQQAGPHAALGVGAGRPDWRSVSSAGGWGDSTVERAGPGRKE